jgi:hypothetical protein
MQEIYDWSQFIPRLKERGTNMAAWCRNHDFNRKTVSALHCGRYIYFCNYGPIARRIIDQAIKDGLITTADREDVYRKIAV